MNLTDRLELNKRVNALTPQEQHDLLIMLVGAMVEKISGVPTIEELISRVDRQAADLPHSMQDRP